MMKNKRISDCCNRFLSIILAVSLSVSPVAVFGAGEDIANHWAKDTITAWQSKGLIKGYEDGSFKPDNAVTRGEFIRLMNQALGLSNKGAVNFLDVTQTDWFYNDVAIAMGEGYTAGFPDGTFQPNQSVTRAQAASFVSKATGLSGGTTENFTDAASIPSWANAAIGAMVNAGYFSGYPDGTFRANAVLTRAEAVSMLNRAMGGSTERTTTAAKDVVIDKAGAKLENQTIDGNVIVSEAVGDGEVYFNSLTIQGDLIVQGGGSNSVYLENTTVKGKVVADKKGVHIQIAGKTEISQMEVLQACNFQSASFNSNVGTITIMDTITDKITIAVPAKNMIVNKKANLFVTKDITNITIAENAKDTKLDIAADATIDTIKANARFALSGAGKIELLEANANGITVAKTIKITKTVTATGITSPGQSTSSSGGSGGGGGSSSGSDEDKDKVLVTGISINQATASVQVGSSVSLTATIEPANASNKTVTWTSDKPAIATVSDGVVEGIAKGTAVITVTSNNGKTAACTVTVTGTNKPTKPEEPENPDKPEEPEEPNEVEEALLDTADELKKAIEENYGEPIILQGDILGSVTATYAGNDDITICLNGHSLGDVDITAPGAEKIDIVDAPPTRMVTLAVAPYFASPRKAFNIGKLKIKAPIAKIDLSVAIADVFAAVKEVAINKSVQKLTAEKSTDTGTTTKVSGTGSVDTVVAETPIDISTETVSEVVAKAPVELNTDVGTVSVPEDESGDTPTEVQVTVADGKTIDSLQAEKSIVLDGAGTVKTVSVTTTTTTTVTVNGTTTVTTVVKSETTTVTIKGDSENKPAAPVTISEITLNGEPKNSYFVGESLDVSGLTLTVTYSNGDSHEVAVAPSMVSGFDSSTATEVPQMLTVGFAGKTETFDIVIVEPKVTSIAIKPGQYKKLYNVGDTLDVSKLAIIATYETEVKKEISAQDNGVVITGFESNKIGAQKLTITYGEQIASYTVIVSQNTPIINEAIAATDITTGQTLLDSILSGTFKVSETNSNPVTGELAWDDDTTVVNETGNYPWTFVPDDATKYAVVRGTVSVKATDPAKKDPAVDKAVTATAITKGEALSVSELKGTFKAEDVEVEGILAWADETVIVKETGEQAWIFTPTDTKTYNVATGKIEVTANDIVINPTAEQKIDITARIKVANKMASSNVVAGAIDGVTPGVAVSGATEGTWAVGNQPVATITYTPVKDKTFAGSNWAKENFNIPKDATIEVEMQGSLLQVVVTFPKLSLSPAEELIMARRAIEAGVYEIPNESQGSESERIAWLQDAVDENIPAGNQTTAVVTFNDGKYIVELSIEGAALSGDTATITVTEATSAQKELDKIIKNLTSITVPLPDEGTVCNTITKTAQKMISKGYTVRIDSYTYNKEEGICECGFTVSPEGSQDSSNDARTEQDVTIKIINKGVKPSISALEGVPLKYDRLNPSDIRFKYTLGEGGYALCKPKYILIGGSSFGSASFAAENGEIRIPKAILQNNYLQLGFSQLMVVFTYEPADGAWVTLDSNSIQLEVLHDNASTSTDILSNVYDINLDLKTIKAKEGAAKEAQITIDTTVEEFMQRITAKDKWQGISMMHNNNGNWEYKSKEKFLADGDAVQVISESGTANVKYKLIMTPYVSTAADELAKIKIQEDPYAYFSVPADADLDEITHLILEKAKTMIKGDYEVTTQDVTITEGNNPLKTWHGKFVVTNTKNAEDTATGEMTDVGLALPAGSKQENIIFSIPANERADHNTLVIKLARGKFVEDIEKLASFGKFSLRIGGVESQLDIPAHTIDLNAERTEATVKINKKDFPNRDVNLYMESGVFEANPDAVIRPYHVQYAFSTEEYSSSVVVRVKEDAVSQNIIREIALDIKIALNSEVSDVINALTSDDGSIQRYSILNFRTNEPITSGIITGELEKLQIISEDGLNKEEYYLNIAETLAGEQLAQLDVTSVHLTSEDEAQQELPVESRIITVLSKQIAKNYKLELLEGTFDDSTADETVAGTWRGKIKITSTTNNADTATSESPVDITIYKTPKTTETPKLTGVSLTDDPDTSDSTKVTLPELTDANNSFVYMISTDENEVPTPGVGTVLDEPWAAVPDGGVIQVEHGKNIGFAEVDASKAVVKFINLTAVVETVPDEIAAPELTGASLADDPNTSDSTMVTLPNLESGNTIVYMISIDENEVPVPNVGTQLNDDWQEIADGDVIQVEHGKNIGFAEVDASKAVVRFINLTAVVEG